jgi:hypothetical protein
MIVDKKVEVKIHRANIRFYKEKYNCVVNDIIFVDIYDLPTGVSIPVLVKCDLCSSEKKLSYKKYIKNINNGGYYSCSSKCANDKRKKTYFERTGFTHQLLNPLILDKIKDTCISRYGFDSPNKSEIIKDKTRKTCMIKYNSNNYVNSVKYKQNMFEKYGVENPMQSNEINDKRIKSSFLINDFESIKYQGKYELDFLYFCKKNDINISKTKFTIDYYEDGKKKKYLPDFYIDSMNLIIEIKSTYYYNLHKSKNILKKEYTIKGGYRYIIILDKSYDIFIKLYNELTQLNK